MTIVLIGLVFLLALAAGIAWFPYWRESKRLPMDDALRAQAPGEFVRLSQGITHFQWLGSSRGPVAVCIHGLTTPSFVWHGLAQGLGRLGYRVLVYDLYGRGFSDRVPGPQDRAFFLQQLDELLDHLDIDDDLTLVGYSMGGAIAAAWAADNPLRMRDLMLLAPAGLGKVELTAQRKRMMQPVVGDWLMHLLYPAMHRRGTEAERRLTTSVPGIVDLQQAELRKQGFIAAVLASLRGILSENRAADHLKISESLIPVLAIFGEEDTIIPLVAMDQLTEWNPDADVVGLDGAGHGLTYTHTDAILHHIREFLRNKPI